MKKILTIILVVVVVALALLWRSGDASKDHLEVKKVGVIIPLSGPASKIGEGLKRALDMAEPKNVELVYVDDECNTTKSISAYNNLKTKGIKLYFVACSGSVMALAPLAKTDNNLIVTGYAGSSEIRKTGDEVIRLDPDAISIGNALIKSIDGSVWSGKKYAIFYEKQDYAQSMVDALRSKFQSQVVAEESYLATDMSMKTQIAKLKNSEANAIIYVPVSDKSADIVLKEMMDLKVNLPLIGEVNLCGFTSKPSQFGLHGFCLNQKIGTEGARKFEKDYLAKYNTASQYPVNDGVSYDTIKIVDRIIGSGVDSISGLKKEILKGVEGDIMTYKFEPNGEVIDEGYFIEEVF